jgi:hypothetical protein
MPAAFPRVGSVLPESGTFLVPATICVEIYMATQNMHPPHPLSYRCGLMRASATGRFWRCWRRVRGVTRRWLPSLHALSEVLRYERFNRSWEIADSVDAFLVLMAARYAFSYIDEKQSQDPPPRRLMWAGGLDYLDGPRSATCLPASGR